MNAPPSGWTKKPPNAAEIPDRVMMRDFSGDRLMRSENQLPKAAPMCPSGPSGPRLAPLIKPTSAVTTKPVTPLYGTRPASISFCSDSPCRTPKYRRHRPTSSPPRVATRIV